MQINRMKVNMGNMAVFLWLGLTMMSTPGCGVFGFGAKKLFHEVKGGEGRLVVIHDPGPTALMDYQYVQIERFPSQMGSTLPGYTPALIQEACIKELSKKPALYELIDPGVKKKSTLIIRGRIIHYQASSGISSVFSSFSQMICRVELVDAESDKVIGQANCVGLSKAIARSGIEELSEGVAEAIKEWLMTSPKKEDDD